LPISFPGQFNGRAQVSSDSQLWGAEANVIGGLCRSDCISADVVLGFRYAALNESLDVTSNTASLSPTGLTGFNGTLVGQPNSISTFDHFQTRNEFYGGQVGLRSEFRYNRVYVDLRTDLALGNVYQFVNVAGGTTLTGVNGTVASLPGGLLAVSSNSGRTSQNHFTFIPDAQIKVGYQVTGCLGIFIGYSFMYWYDVLRPGDQIDRTVNPGLVPSNIAFGTATGPIRPAVSLDRTDSLAQGLDFGVELRF